MAKPNADRAAQRALYVEWCASRLTDTVTAVEQQRAASERELLAASAKLLRDVRRHRSAERRAAELREQRTRRLDAAGVDFDALIALPTIARVQPTEYGWCIVTTPLCASCDGCRYELGKYELHLTRDGHLRVLNQTKRVATGRATWDHPRVRDGTPLLEPDRRVRTVRAIAARQVGGAVAELIAFLTGADACTGIVPITQWSDGHRTEEESHGRQVRRWIE